jgi:hypothetical protein
MQSAGLGRLLRRNANINRQSQSEISNLNCVLTILSLALEPEKTVIARRRQYDLILQIRKIEPR